MRESTVQLLLERTVYRKSSDYASRMISSHRFLDWLWCQDTDSARDVQGCAVWSSLSSYSSNSEDLDFLFIYGPGSSSWPSPVRVPTSKSESSPSPHVSSQVRVRVQMCRTRFRVRVHQDRDSSPTRVQVRGLESPSLHTMMLVGWKYL